MKKLLTLVLTLCFALTACMGLAGCGKTITVGYTDYPPMNYTDDNGKLVGFDTELAQKVFKELGYKIRFKEIDWNNKYSELNGGTIDCIWNGFTANCADSDGVQRSTKVDFTYNYMTNAQCVIRLASSTELTDATQFAGNSVAYEQGSAGETYASELTGANLKAVGSQMTAIMEVKAGTSQYAVVDLLLARSIAGQGDYANVVINEGIVIDAEYYAIGFKIGSELTAQVNSLLVKYAADGSLATLAEKYGLSNQIILDYSDQIA